MLFSKTSSPFVRDQSNVQDIMLKVLVALVPGSLAAIWFFGWGVLINLVIASSTCLLAETWVMWVRGRDIKARLSASPTACSGITNLNL